MKVLRVTTIVLGLLLPGCQNAVVSGRVTDVFGRPVDEAIVMVEGTSFSTATTSAGKYAVQFVPGQFRVRIRKDGYTTSTLPFSVTEATEVPAADVVLYPLPTEAGIYYIGEEKLEPLVALRLLTEEIQNPIAWLPGSMRYLLQKSPAQVLPEGNSRFIDTVPETLQLARAVKRSGLVLDSANSEAAGFLESHDERVGDEGLIVREVHLEPGVYGWIEMRRNMLGGRIPGERYYGFQVGDAPWSRLPQEIPPAIARMIAGNIELEMRSFDENTGTVQIYNKRTGETIAISPEDLQR